MQICRMSGFLALMVLLVSLGTISCSLSCAAFWQDVKHDLMGGKQSVFQDTVAPLTQFTKVTYTWRLHTEIPGWRLIHNTSSSCGMHALTYLKTTEPKVAVIAIRGTQLGSTNGSLCDICAGAFLKGEQSRYPFCKHFPEEKINYFQQAKDYTTKMMKEYDLDCIGFTGHSLGAALSELMSVQYKAEYAAIVFASPGMKASVKIFGIEPHFENVMNLYSEYDPIVVLPRSMNNQSGMGCKFEDGPIPSYCESCFRDPSFDITNLNNSCGLCFLDKHIYKHYLNMIFVDKKTPKCLPFETFVSYSSTGSRLSIPWTILNLNGAIFISFAVLIISAMSFW